GSSREPPEIEGLANTARTAVQQAVRLVADCFTAIGGDNLHHRVASPPPRYSVHPPPLPSPDSPQLMPARNKTHPPPTPTLLLSPVALIGSQERSHCANYRPGACV